jgi:hypothetical protein
MKPNYTGHLGDTTFDGETTWLCMGGTEWVDHLPVEEPPKVMWPNLT